MLSKPIHYYALTLTIILVSGFVANKFKNAFETHDEYDLIRAYLLNDSPLYGYNRPKIWIHSRFEHNSRKWKSFMDRSSHDLNQPYIHTTIRSIIDQCGDDFHVCLIDDDTFSKLIPNWSIDLKTVAYPMREHLREIAMAELVYYYGGMAIPNSFLCIRPMIDFYQEHVGKNKAFVCETLNRFSGTNMQNKVFVADHYFMGAPKNSPVVKKYIEYLKKRVQYGHFTSEPEFRGDSATWLMEAVANDDIHLVSGDLIGIKTYKKGKPILMENLLEEAYLDLHPECLGILIPREDVIQRTRFQWFLSSSVDEFLESDTILAKYMKISMIQGVRNDIPANVKSVISL
jgi:hypothetical protein